MNSLIELKVKGLWNAPNPLSEIPKGGLRIASNVVIDEPSLVDCRRGQNFFTSTTTSYNVDQMIGYNGAIIAHNQDELLVHPGTSDATPFSILSSSFSNPDTGYITHGVEANKNLYLTSSLGIKKIDVNLATVTQAGAPAGLDLDCTLSGVTGYLANDSSVAYRIVWGYKDASNNLILGAPSQRVVISNSTGGTRDVALSFTIPTEVTTAWFYQVYRSIQFSPATIEPNDELYLVIEDNPSAGEITSRIITTTDSTPDSLLGATLYTSPSQEGIENANYPPPYAKDITYYQNMTFYANTRSDQRITFNLLGVGGSNLAIGDDITFTLTEDATTIVYTGAVAENIAANEFQIYTGGTVAENIANTALSICRVINRSTSNTFFYAYYLSGFDDLPGQILIQTRTSFPSTHTLSVNSTVPDSFLPSFPQTALADVAPNRVFISKPLQPEAVPLYAYLDIGSANQDIQRIIALRDSVFVFKKDGIFIINGTSFSSLQQNLLDNSTTLLAYESLAVFNNQIMCFVDQGVAAVSSSGVELVSRPIEKTLLQISQFQNFAANTFGVAYESDRKYFLGTVLNDTDPNPTVLFVYNQSTTTWTTWDLQRTSGFVNIADNELYMFNPFNKRFYKERKTYSVLDYIDESYSFTALSVTTTAPYTTFTVSVIDAANISVGDVIFQGVTYSYVSSSVFQSGPNNYLITVTTNPYFDVLQSMSVGKGFISKIQFLPLDMDAPGSVKQTSEFELFFKNAQFNTLLAGFTTDFNPSETQYTLYPQTYAVDGGWGTLDWGAGPWGGVSSGDTEFTIRDHFPRAYCKGHWISPSIELNQAVTNMSFTGMNIQIRPISTKFSGARNG